MDNLRGLLGVRRMDRVPNAQIRKLAGVTKGLDGRSDEGVLRRFGHVERMEKGRIAKRVYLGECAEMDRYREEVFKAKRFGCQANKENGAG